MGDRTPAQSDYQDVRITAMTWGEDGGSLQRLTSRHSMGGTSGARPWPAAKDSDQSKGAGSPYPGHRNRDSLGSGTLRYPRE